MNYKLDSTLNLPFMQQEDARCLLMEILVLQT